MAMYALTSAAPQRERLQRAYKQYLSRLGAKDVPAEIRVEFAALVAHMERGHAKIGECKIKKNVEAAEDRDIVSMINSIIKMYDAVTRYQPLLKNADRGEKPVGTTRLPKRA
jgi:hypothetical protein